MLSFTTSRQLIEKEKETYFLEFQKNNRPSGLEYIKNNTLDYMFEAIKDDVLAANEHAFIVVKKIDAKIVDFDDTMGYSNKVASVQYMATISTDGNMEDINEIWHFKYDGWHWKLAGIQQANQ